MNDINQKLDKIQEDIMDIKETLVRNTTSLELHMQRTELAEQRIELLHQEDSELKEKINSHINQIKGAAIAVAAIGSILFGLWQMGILSKLL